MGLERRSGSELFIVDNSDAQRDELIRRIERPLLSRYDVRNVFAPRWDYVSKEGP